MSAAKALDQGEGTVDKAQGAQNRDLNSRFEAKMRAAVADNGRPDTVRNTILSLVAGEAYDRAVSTLKTHLESKNEYPQFKQRSERYIAYAIDLINAIKVKRSFPGLQHLAMAKQQELFDRSMEHFEDLKSTLKKIDVIESEVRIEDLRSTVVVIQVGAMCVFAILVVAFTLEVSRGVIPTLTNLADSGLSYVSDTIMQKLGF